MINILLEVEAETDVGLVKKVNEDSFLVQLGEDFDDEFGLFIICDGVGGLDAGEVASLTCVEKFKKWFDKDVWKCLRKDNPRYILSQINDVVLECNNELIKMQEEQGNKMGSTASVLLIIGNKYYIAHVGDSRIYKYSDDRLVQITEDQSFVNLQVKQGIITPAEAKVSKQKNILLQCVGSTKDLEILNYGGIIEEDTTFLICCDGFYNKLEDDELKNLCYKFYKSKRGGSKLLKKHIELLKKREERDNISVIAINCTGEDHKEKKGFFEKLFED